MAIASSSELQKISLSAILKDSDLFSQVRPYITEEFFGTLPYKLIYKSQVYFYSKTNNLPTIEELLLVISDMHNQAYGSMDEVKASLYDLWNYQITDSAFLIDKLTTFIKRNRVEGTLKELLPKIQQGNELAIEDIGDKLINSVNVDINTSKAFVLSDINSLAKVREEAIGTIANPTIIKSCIPEINNCLTFKGYKPGDVVMFVSAPGCFTGDTKIMMTDGSTRTIDEIKDMKDLGVYTCDKSTGNVVVGTSEYVHLSKYTKDLIEVEVDTNYTIKCTPDHPFLLKSGIYKKAEELECSDELMSITRTPVISTTSASHVVSGITKLVLDKEVPVYGLIEAVPNHNYALAISDDTGVFVSNSGKTMWMINECANSAQQGYNSLHIFVGDMKEYDGFIRYASRFSGVLQDDIVAMPVDQQMNLVQQYNYTGVFNRMFTKAYPAGSMTMNQLIADINKLQKEYGVHFDMIAIDYPDNLVPESTMMYESGGDIYNNIAKFGYQNSSVMLTGSQPKLAYWKDEILPMEAAAESSKKQHVVDLVITAGKRFKGSTMVTYHLAKVRRGHEGAIIRIKSSFERAYLEQTSEQEYLTYIADNT